MEDQKLKAYFAHPVATYDTDIEKYFIKIIEKQGYEVVNPNQPEHQTGYEEQGMDYFKDLVLSCDALFLLPFSDNKIGSGTAIEFNWMREAHKRDSPKHTYILGIINPIQYVPIEVTNKVLTREETRERNKNKDV